MTKLKPMIIMLLAVGIVFAAVFGFEIFRGKMIQKALGKLRNPAQTVSTVVARSQPWQSRLEAVGSVRALNVAIQRQVAGTVSTIHSEWAVTSRRATFWS